MEAGGEATSPLKKNTAQKCIVGTTPKVYLRVETPLLENGSRQVDGFIVPFVNLSELVAHSVADDEGRGEPDPKKKKPTLTN
jgi:hypothetical protein